MTAIRKSGLLLLPILFLLAGCSGKSGQDPESSSAGLPRWESPEEELAALAEEEAALANIPQYPVSVAEISNLLLNTGRFTEETDGDNLLILHSTDNYFDIQLGKADVDYINVIYFDIYSTSPTTDSELWADFELAATLILESIGSEYDPDIIKTHMATLQTVDFSEDFIYKGSIELFFGRMSSQIDFRISIAQTP